MFAQFTNIHDYLACFHLVTSPQHVYAINKRTSNDLIAVIPVIRPLNKSQLEDGFFHRIFYNLAALKRYVPKVNKASQLTTTLSIVFHIKIVHL